MEFSESSRRRIPVRRASQAIADELRVRILTGGFAESERLPPAPVFAEMLGVSGHHLREALRLLEQDGLVRVRSGRNGGVFVTVPGVEVLTRNFSSILARNGVPLSDLMIARLSIEPKIAEIATIEATEAELDEIGEVVQQQEEMDVFSPGLNATFHLLVSAASHNRTLQLMMQSIESVIRGVDVQVGNRELARGSWRAHRAIWRAMVARDATRAGELVHRHLLGFEDQMRASGFDPDVRTVADALAGSRREVLGEGGGRFD